MYRNLDVLGSVQFCTTFVTLVTKAFDSSASGQNCGLQPPIRYAMDITKKQLVSQLNEAAKLLEVLAEEPHRARAYANAARQVENFEGDIPQLFAAGKLTQIRGVGQGLAAELMTLKERETLPVLDELYERVPQGVRNLFVVSGLGAKKISLLWQNGIANLDELVQASRDGRVAALRGFGKKSAESILAAAEFALEAKKRMRLDVAEAYVAALQEVLSAALPEASITFAGSLRRSLETVGDLDVIVTGVSFEEVMGVLEPFVDDLETNAPHLEADFEGRRLELSVVQADAVGAALAVQTGGKAFVKMLEEKAAEKGYKLRTEGLFKGDELVSTPTEESVFKSLDLSYIPPERRESAETSLPENLISLDAMHGVIHNHSDWSDGASSLREMVAAARALGYRYLAMADHSRTSYYANGLSIKRVEQQAREIEKIRRELLEEGSDFRVLHGLEVDIMPDGKLDYPDEVLATLDYTVISVHQNFTLSEAKQTERIVNAVHNPYATILAHPTGRLLLRRPGYAVDLQEVIRACAETGTVVEINANTRRLDLDWRWVIKAKALGCTFSIDPDAHHTSGYDDVRYGVMMARKAGLAVDDVVNTAPTAEDFLARLKPRP